MNPARRPAVPLVMLFGAVVFGMVLAGALDLGPQGRVEPAAYAAAQGPTPTGAVVPPSTMTSMPSFADLAEQVLPAVVSIQAESIETGGRRRGQPDPFEFFFGPRSQPQPPGQPEREFRSQAGGSGFLVSGDGLVVTNNHVIDGASKILVRLGDRDYVAELKGVDPATDLALLQIDAGRDLPFLVLGDSELLRVGDYVMAVGNPLLLDHTVTVGVVSAKGRSIGLTQDASFENFIQTDAAINRGNSGGPLVDLAGRVIGIATAMNWGAENIGFAVPVDTLKAVLPQLREKGRVSRGYLGVHIQGVDWERAQAFGLDAAGGALVTSVVAGEPADVAGVRHGDIVLTVDGRKVKETRDLIDYVSSKAPGEKVELGILRDGKRVTRTVELTERRGLDEVTEPAGDQGVGGIDWLGLDYQDLTPHVRQTLGIPAAVSGVVVREVTAASPLYDEGVGTGDVVTEVNGQAIESSDHFENLVGGAPSGAYLRLYVRRFDPHSDSDAGIGFFAIVRVP